MWAFRLNFESGKVGSKRIGGYPTWHSPTAPFTARSAVVSYTPSDTLTISKPLALAFHLRPKMFEISSCSSDGFFSGHFVLAVKSKANGRKVNLRLAPGCTLSATQFSLQK